MAKNILEIKNLTFSFHTYGGVVKSVRDVSFNVREGEILGIVGESGCGKSVTSQCILKLNPEPPGFFEGGSIKYKGEEIITKTDREMRKIRGVEIGFIFQDPMTSLNPTMTVGKQIEEVFVGRKGMTRAEVRERALEILRLVGINEPERRYKQYPHELSGGMKQRVMSAIALVGKPSIIIAAARWLKKERLMRSSMRRHIRTRQVLSNQSLRWIPPRIRSWCPSTEHRRICSHRRKDARLQRAVSLR